MNFTRISFLLISLFLLTTAANFAQKASQSRQYELCGDPHSDCQTAHNFGAGLPLIIPGELEWMGQYKSQPFYAVIVQSRKVIFESNSHNDNYRDCGGQFTDNERSSLQRLFPSNRVFSSEFGCYYFQHSYTNVKTDYNFLAVYGGKTKVAAEAVLKTVRATGKYPGANIRQMQAVLCNGCH